jgi:hypothetical protein
MLDQTCSALIPSFFAKTFSKVGISS